MRLLSTFVCAALLAIIAGQAFATDIPMLPPQDFTTGLSCNDPGSQGGGLLVWDGTRPIRCIPGSSADMAGTGSITVNNLKTNGAVQTGYQAGATCTAADAGKIRWNGSYFEGCDGAIWSVLGPPHAFGGMFTVDNWLGCEIGNIFADGQCGCPAWAPYETVGYTAMQGFIYVFIFVNDLHYCYSNSLTSGGGGGQIIGMCGAANGVATTTAPTTNLCRTGTPSAVSGGLLTNWTWTCIGSNAQATDHCSAPYGNYGGTGGAGGK